MAEEEPDTALLEIDDVAGALTPEEKGSFYEAIFEALAQTRRFRLLPRGLLPELPAHPDEQEPRAVVEAFAGLSAVRQVFLARFEPITAPLTGRDSWRISLLLYDALDGRRLALREGWLDRGAPAQDLRWLVYEFSEPERFQELARGHRLAGLAREPEKLKGDREYLSTVLLAHLQRGSWSAAVADADALLELDPDDASAWHGKALALLRERRPLEAGEAVEKELGLRPNPEGLILKGDIAQARGGRADALDSYREAARLEGARGARAHAKLAALERLVQGLDALEVSRMGWMWGYLHYVGSVLKGDLSEELQAHLRTVGAELENEFRELTGVHLSRLAGLDRWNAWVRALNARDPKACREAGEACFGSREVLAEVTDCLPDPAKRWLRFGRELFWVQAVFYAAARHWDEPGGGQAPQAEEEILARESALLAADGDLESSNPDLTALGRRLSELAARPSSKEKLDAAVRLIEEFRRILFKDAPD